MRRKRGNVPDFHDVFQREAEASEGVHGRFNLIGDHAELGGGSVLSFLAPQMTRVHMARRPDENVVVFNHARPHEVARYRLRSESRLGLWPDFIQAASWVLRDAGFEIGGFDLFIESDIPTEAGMAAEMATLIATMRVVRIGFGLRFMKDEGLVHLAQRAAAEFIGLRRGMADPVAIEFGREDAASLVETSSFHHRLVSWDPTRFRIFLIDSGVPQRNLAGGWSDREVECREAAQRLGVKSLREISPADLDRMPRLPDPLLRRVRHLVTENVRVAEVVNALQAGDGSRFGQLLSASYHSLRDDFETSIREIDILVETAQDQSEVFGARPSGGGFGGVVVVIAEPSSDAGVAARIARRYQHLTGRDPVVLMPTTAPRICNLELTE